jgi:CcmD family protein
VSTGAQYVVAAYGVVLFGLLLYVVVLGLRSARLAREAELLARLVERDEARSTREPAATP